MLAEEGKPTIDKSNMNLNSLNDE